MKKIEKSKRPSVNKSNTKNTLKNNKNWMDLLRLSLNLTLKLHRKY